MRFLDHTKATPARMLSFLRACGHDLSGFDLQRLERLLRDISTLDGMLVQDSATGRIWRVCSSVKTLIICGAYALIETQRRFYGGDPLRQRYPWSISETRKRWEPPLACAIRGILEELGPYVPMFELMNVKLVQPVFRYAEPLQRPSRVYPGIWSHTEILSFEWNAPAGLFDTREKIVIRDSGTEILLEWVPVIEVERIEFPLAWHAQQRFIDTLPGIRDVDERVPEEWLAIVRT